MSNQLLPISDEIEYSDATLTGRQPKSDWQRAPEKLLIAVQKNNLAYVNGTANNEAVDTWTEWWGMPQDCNTAILQVRAAAERFRAAEEHYLDAIDPADLKQRLLQYRPPEAWHSLKTNADAQHQEVWRQVALKDTSFSLANWGYTLYQRFFPVDTMLRQLLDQLTPGARLMISWQKTAGGSWIPHVPWGMMYRTPPRRGEPIDALQFLGLRFRIDYRAHDPKRASPALGDPKSAYRGHGLYWGGQANDPVFGEARWQHDLWANADGRHVFVPTDLDPTTARGELVKLIEQPSPEPMPVLYFYCECDMKAGGKPILRFGSTNAPANVIEPDDLSHEQFRHRPLVFVNACGTAVSPDPFVANELETQFFERGCRAYLGTVAKVPIHLASRFAAIFFHFFGRQVDGAPVAAGEAAAHTRMFLWTQYCNLGGLYYAQINQYDLYLAHDEELRQFPD
jgi:hypothetical protein